MLSKNRIVQQFMTIILLYDESVNSDIKKSSFLVRMMFFSVTLI